MDRPVAVEPDPDPVLLVDAVRLPDGAKKVAAERLLGETAQERAAPLGRRIGQAVARRLAHVERGHEVGQRQARLPGRRQGREDRQHRVAGRQGREDLAAGPVADRAVRSGEEAAIGLEAADDPRPVPRRPLHAGDHEGRADPGAQHAPEAARALDGRAGRHRHHDGVGAEIPGGDQAEDVAPQDAAACIGDEGTVGVAVGGDERVERAGGHGLADERDVLRAMGLGVDRHERLGPADRHGVGAERRQHVDEHVAGDRALLVDRDREAGQDVRSEDVEVAAAVARDRVRLRLGRDGRGEGRRIGNVAEGAQDGGLVGLGDLAVGAVELQAVAIVRDMAAGDHDGEAAAPCRLEREGRRRQRAAIDRGQAGRGRRGGDRGGDSRAAGAQVAPDHDLAAHARLGADGGEERGGIGEAGPPGQVRHQAAQPGGAEFQTVHRAMLFETGRTHIDRALVAPEREAAARVRRRPVRENTMAGGAQ